MHTYKIISNFDEGGHTDISESIAVPDTTPEGRVVQPEERQTRFVVTDENMFHESMLQRGVLLVRPVGEQVRLIAESIRQQLHDFVHSNTRPPARLGFMTRGTEPINVDSLVANCRQACSELESIFTDRSSADGLGVNVRTFAHRVQSSLELFLVSLVRRQTTSGIGEGDIGEVLHECIALKGDLATTMQQIDAMNVELKAALMQQYQMMSAGDGSETEQ